MAVEIFLRIDGVNGGSRNYYHKGWSDVVSWKWNLSTVGSAGETTLDMDQIQIVKRIGMDSPGIMTLFAEGRVVPKVEISMVPVVGKREAQQKYLGMVMEDVVIAAIATGGAAEETLFSEQLTLRFQRVRFEYNQYSEATPDAASGAAETYGFNWDVAKRTAW